MIVFMRVCELIIGQVGELVPGFVFFDLCMCRLSMETTIVADKENPD